MQVTASDTERMYKYNSVCTGVGLKVLLIVQYQMFTNCVLNAITITVD